VKKKLKNNEIIYFELNNWFAGRDYPNTDPFLTWLSNDNCLSFEDEEWVKKNKLCVICQPIDMSVNFCITTTEEWVEKNCPELLTKYTEFLRFPDEEDDVVYGKFGTEFLQYSEENIGIRRMEEPIDE